MSESFSRTFPVGRRVAKFKIGLPMGPGVNVGAVHWSPDVPQASDLTESEWAEFRRARSAFDAALGDAVGVEFMPPETMQ